MTKQLAGYQISEKCKLRNKELFTWSQAQSLAEKMNEAEFDGYSDWKLPSKSDWEKIASSTETFLDIFPDDENRYWSSDSDVDKKEEAPPDYFNGYAVNFRTAEIIPNWHSLSLPVRLVRA